MTITVETETEVDFPFDYEELARRVITFTTDHENFPFEAEVNLLLVDNEAIHRINREYRQIDRRMFCHFRCFPMKRQEILTQWKTAMITLIRIPEK